MTHLIIEVGPEVAEDRQGTSQKTGKPYRVVTQKAYAHVGDLYPIPFTLNIDHEKGQHPYAPGKYLLGAKSVTKGEYGIQLSRYLDLVPLPAANKPQS